MRSFSGGIIYFGLVMTKNTKVLQAELAADGSSFFIAVWDTVQESSSIFQVCLGKGGVACRNSFDVSLR